MDVLGLPGRDAATEAWLTDVMRAFELPEGERTVQRYRCWDDGADFDLAGEVARATASAPDLVVAKSMGTRVAIHAAHSGGLVAPEWVLIGLPLAAYAEGELDLVRALCGQAQVLIIQQTDDFLGGFEQVRAAVDSNRPTFAEVPGEDHVYSDVAELGGIVQTWRAGLPR
jgi:predicted alpha/beta-hydrolase family hydrolase